MEKNKKEKEKNVIEFETLFKEVNIKINEEKVRRLISRENKVSASILFKEVKFADKESEEKLNESIVTSSNPFDSDNFASTDKNYQLLLNFKNSKK